MWTKVKFALAGMVVFAAGFVTALPIPDAQPVRNPVWAVSSPYTIGSAFIVGEREDETFWLTAAHVVTGPYASMQTINGYKVTVVKVSKTHDLALISTPRVPSLSAKPLEFAPEYSVMQEAFSNGWTWDEDYNVIHLRTSGTISGNGRDFILYDGGVHPGQSGSPLFDEQGRVLGLLTSVLGSQYGANTTMAVYLDVPTLTEFLEGAY